MTQKRNLTRRDFLRLGAVTATGAAIAACAPSTPEVVEVEKPVVVEKEVVKEVPVEKVVEKEVQRVVTPTPAGVPVIRWQGSTSGSYMECNTQGVEIFNEQHPDIDFRLEPIPPGDRMEKLMAAMVAGVAPDIFEHWALWFAKYDQKGQLMDVQPYIDQDVSEEDLADFLPNLLDNYSRLSYIPGKMLAIPRYVNFMWLHYNEDYLDEAGVDHPDASWTLDDLAEAAAKCTVRDADGYVEQFGCTFDSVSSMERQFYNLERFGGAFVRYEEPDKCLLDTPESQEALEWMRARIWDDETWMNNLMLESMGGGEAVRDGYCALQEEGGPYFQWLIDVEGLRTINFTHPPKGPKDFRGLSDGRTSYMVTDGFGMWKFTKWPDAAWECQNFLGGPIYQELRMRASGRLACRMSSMAHFKEAWVDLIGPLMEHYNLDVVMEAIEMGYGRDDERFICQSEAEEIINPLLEKVFQVGGTPVSVLADACPDIDAAMECDMADMYRDWKGSA